MTQPVLIIGAGLSGLSLARTLLARNVPIRVFEASPQARKHSYGITLLDWAYEPLASGLKLGSVKAFKAATATDSPVGGSGVIKPDYHYRHAYDGRPLLSPQGIAQSLSFRCNRSRLGKLLMQGVHVEFGYKLEKVETTSTGVLLHFAGGKTAKGCLAVGADGVHSAG